MRSRIIFITGTDTGVGKTVLTGLLLSHLRHTGCRVLALKPFCSGGRADAELLRELQDGELTLDEINPFHFKEPVAALVAARLHRRKIPLPAVLGCIQNALERLNSKNSKLKTPVLLIEGAGGLLSPLGETNSGSRIAHPLSKVLLTKEGHAPFALERSEGGSRARVQTSIYSALDSIKALDCEVVLVTANRLGTINHTLLTLDKLGQAGIHHPVLVLNHLLSDRNSGLDSRFNGPLISQIAGPMHMIHLPYLGKCSTAREIKDRARKLRNPLRKIMTLSTAV